MNTMEKECPVCGSTAELSNMPPDGSRTFVQCPVCGRYEFNSLMNELESFDKNKLASYFAYNGFDNKRHSTGIEYRYFTTLSKEKCDEYRQEFDSGKNTHGRPVCLSEENVNAWYPYIFSERIDCILKYFAEKSKRIGTYINVSKKEALSVLFLNRFDCDKNIKLNDLEITRQLVFMYNFLCENDYIEYSFMSDGMADSDEVEFSLTAKAYIRLDELRKKETDGKNVLVAMKFGNETKELREAIRKGILDAGYNAILIDEVEHNDFITPELLKYIRDSKFVVVDLTHKNNGAYFEEGYAMGIGKPVIQLCKNDTQLHFDIAQKNTIIWNEESEIPLRLTNRIKATIE